MENKIGKRYFNADDAFIDTGHFLVAYLWPLAKRHRHHLHKRNGVGNELDNVLF